jgi:acyl-CoA thioesterase-1
MRTLVCLMAAGLSLGAGAVEAAPVVALGASNTEGRGRGKHPDGVSKADAYPAQLQRMLIQSGCRTTVLNAGRAGDTTENLLARVRGVLAKDTRVVILQPGGNDARRGRGDARAGNITNLQNIITAHGASVVMLDNLGRLAPQYRLPDGQHYSVEGHVIFARAVLPQVRAALKC